MLAVTTSTTNQLDKFGQGVFPNNEIGSKTDFFNQRKFKSVVCKFSIETTFAIFAKISIVNRVIVDAEIGSKVSADIFKSDNVQVEDSNRNLVSNQVDEKSGRSFDVQVTNSKHNIFSAGKVANWKNSERSSVKISSPSRGRNVEVNKWQSNLQVGREGDDIDGNVGNNLRKSFSSESLVVGSSSNLKNGVKGEVEFSCDNDERIFGRLTVLVWATVDVDHVGDGQSGNKAEGEDGKDSLHL